MRRDRQEKLERLDPETRVTRMQRLLLSMDRGDYGNTRIMATFMNLYCVHVPTVRDNEESLGFYASLDLPDGREFTEDTFDRIVWRYDDLRAGKDPSQATAVVFDAPGSNPPSA